MVNQCIIYSFVTKNEIISYFLNIGWKKTQRKRRKKLIMADLDVSLNSDVVMWRKLQLPMYIYTGYCLHKHCLYIKPFFLYNTAHHNQNKIKWNKQIVEEEEEVCGGVQVRTLRWQGLTIDWVTPPACATWIIFSPLSNFLTMATFVPMEIAFLFLPSIRLSTNNLPVETPRVRRSWLEEPTGPLMWPPQAGPHPVSPWWE